MAVGWRLGHRNPLGLAFQPETGTLWETEQGPQGGDEVNIIHTARPPVSGPVVAISL